MNLNLPIRYIFLIFLFFFLQPQSICIAQSPGNSPALIQFSGVVVSGDSLKPLPFVSIMVKHTRRGTVSDYYGYFSFVAQSLDTIEFNAIGFRKATFIIPDTLAENRYSLIQMLHNDTIFLKETIIYPWPTREQFKQAFMSLNVPDDKMEIARKNLARAEMKDRYETIPMDGSLNHKYYTQQYNSRIYYAGQLPPNNLLNPIAWAQFIKAWQNGDFKRKDK